MTTAPHPIAERIHDRVLQLLGAAMLQSEMAEHLSELGRQDEVQATLGDLRTSLDLTVIELRRIMSDLRDADSASSDTRNVQRARSLATSG
jgi:signal transduction histidine kinase